MKSRLRIATLGIALLLAGCASSPLAPVIERTPQSKKSEASKHAIPPTTTSVPVGGESDQRPDIYTVKKSDTLYSIGLEYGFDYKEIAQKNDIPPPYVIHVGQLLKLPKADAASLAVEPVAVTPLKPESLTNAKPTGDIPLFSEPKAIKEPYSVQAMVVGKVTETAPKQQAKQVVVEKTSETPETEAAKVTPPPEKSISPSSNGDESVEWMWPTTGKVISGFNESANSKGIEIGGTPGQAVYAAAQGKVVYSGTGLRGYGKLIIIKHTKTYLSAYAHNSKMLVKEGQEISKGQKIAEMGNTDTDSVKLHFEIRRLGKPVDPIKYLPTSN